MSAFVLSVWIVFQVDTSAAKNVTFCRTVFVNPELEGYTIQNGELRLNPDTRQVQWRGRITKLSNTQYMILENLILADGAPVAMDTFSTEGERNAAERGSDPNQYAFGKNWVVVNINRLRKFLNETLDASLGERIVTLNGRGFAWTTDKMRADAESYDPNRLTYLWEQQRLFKGKHEIYLSPGAWLAVDRYVNNSFQLITREGWNEIWRRDFKKAPTYNALTIMISKANAELMAVLGIDSKVLLKDGIPGIGGWRMDASVFDLESMPTPVRNRSLKHE